MLVFEVVVFDAICVIVEYLLVDSRFDRSNRWFMYVLV